MSFKTTFLPTHRRVSARIVGLQFSVYPFHRGVRSTFPVADNHRLSKHLLLGLNTRMSRYCDTDERVANDTGGPSLTIQDTR